MAISTAAAIIGSAVVGGIAATKSAKSARKAQEKGQERAQESVERAAAQAREDALRLFGEAGAQRLGGFQGAQNIFAGTVPQQFDIFQQGNIQAQQTAGLAPQQIQNALLGLPVDFGFLQPSAPFQPDFGFLNQTLAGQPTPEEIAAQEAAAQQALNQPTLNQQTPLEQFNFASGIPLNKFNIGGGF